jgi:hypothetical protein
LRNVTFLPGVAEVGESAFRACPPVILVIPPSVKLKLFGACTFADWRELARVELGGVMRSAFARSTVVVGCTW